MDSVPYITTRGGGENTNLKYGKVAIILFSYRYDTETNNSRDYKLLFSCQPLDYFDKYPFPPFWGNNFKELRDTEGKKENKKNIIKLFASLFNFFLSLGKNKVRLRKRALFTG